MTESDLIETRKVLESYGDETLNTMRNILISNKKLASGDLIESLSYQIVYDGEMLDIEFSMVDYGIYVDKGRKPGKFPPIASIRNWAAQKGIDQKFVFPIARKIANFGIAPTPFYESSILSGKDKLLRDLEVAMTKDINLWLQKQINNNF